jgi:hypothetical protein
MFPRPTNCDADSDRESDIVAYKIRMQQHNPQIDMIPSAPLDGFPISPRPKMARMLQKHARPIPLDRMRNFPHVQQR